MKKNRLIPFLSQVNEGKSKGLAACVTQTVSPLNNHQLYTVIYSIKVVFPAKIQTKNRLHQ